MNEQQKKNFLVVDSSEHLLRLKSVQDSFPAETPVATIEATFLEYTERKDIAILLINQHVSSPFRAWRNR